MFYLCLRLLGLDELPLGCARISVVSVYCGSNLHASAFLILIECSLLLRLSFGYLSSKVKKLVKKVIPMVESLGRIVSS